MAEKEGKNINTALKGVLASDSTLIGLVDGNVRQIETDVEGGLMSFDKGVTKEDLQSLEPIGKVELGDNKAVSGNEVYQAIPKINLSTDILKKEYIPRYLASKGSANEGRLVNNGSGYTSVINLEVKDLSEFFIHNLPTSRRDGMLHNDFLSATNNKSTDYLYVDFNTLTENTLKVINEGNYKYFSMTVLFADEDISKLDNLIYSTSESDDLYIWGINNIPIKSKPILINKIGNFKYTHIDNTCVISSNDFNQNLRVNRGGELPFDVAHIFYKENKIGNRNDESAPYRIDGGTIGGNHLIDGVSRNKNHNVKYFIDGVEVFLNTDLDLDFNEFKVVEYYQIMSVNSDLVIAETNLTYTFYNNLQCIIESNIIGLDENIPLVDIMFLMSEKVTNGGYLIPNTENFDLVKNITENTFATKSNSINKNNPQNRVINISNNYVMKIGFLPLGSNLNREQNTTRKRLEIRGNTGKIYMSTIDSENITTLNKGDIYSAVGYKDYSLNNGKDYSITEVKHNGITYIIIDIYSTEKKQIKYNLLSNLQFKELQNDYDNLYSLTNNVFEIYTDKASIILSSY